MSSCGYSSYEECVKEEVKSNNGKVNQYIKSYCMKEYPPSTSQGEYHLKKSEMKIEWINGNYKFTNYSDYNVDVLKVVFSKKECSDWDLRNFPWENYRNYLPGNNKLIPGQSFSINVESGYKCSVKRAISYTKEY